MHHHRSTMFALIAAGALIPASSFAATSHKADAATPSVNTTAATDAHAVKSDVPPELAKEAKITLEAARSSALARVKNGTVRSEELEREHGKLIYSFDVVVADTSGVTEVNVDAKTGKVLDVHHESPAKEKREAKTESKPPGT